MLTTRLLRRKSIEGTKQMGTATQPQRQTLRRLASIVVCESFATLSPEADVLAPAADDAEDGEIMRLRYVQILTIAS